MCRGKLRSSNRNLGGDEKWWNWRLWLGPARSGCSSDLGMFCFYSPASPLLSVEFRHAQAFSFQACKQKSLAVSNVLPSPLQFTWWFAFLSLLFEDKLWSSHSPAPPSVAHHGLKNEMKTSKLAIEHPIPPTCQTCFSSPFSLAFHIFTVIKPLFCSLDAVTKTTSLKHPNVLPLFFPFIWFNPTSSYLCN